MTHGVRLKSGAEVNCVLNYSQVFEAGRDFDLLGIDDKLRAPRREVDPAFVNVTFLMMHAGNLEKRAQTERIIEIARAVWEDLGMPNK